MKIGYLALLGVFALTASASAQAATSAPRLHAHGAAKHTALAVKKDKKHAHKVHTRKVAQSHKAKHVHHVKKAKPT
jgi:hypothetical protein